MRMTTLASATAAVVVALTLFDMSPVEAAVQRRAVTVRKAPSMRSVQPRVRSVQPRVLHKKVVTPKTVTTLKKGVGPGSASSFVKKTTIGAGTLNLRRLPLHKAAAGNAFLKGRLAVRRTYAQADPHACAGLEIPSQFAPFVQRHWKHAFFWVAVAGIGYLTIPELYYNRFYSCISVDDPIYDDCGYILSYAALEEEEVRTGQHAGDRSLPLQAKAP